MSYKNLLVIFIKILSKLRKIIFKVYREEILSKTICKEIEQIENINKKKIVKILDYGSGYNPILIEKISKIMTIIRKKAKILIIKDHFQYGFFSNLVLVMMDFVGNYGDNVKIPTKYFSIKTFNNFIAKFNLTEIKRINDKKYYKWYWFYFNSKKLQFISILK